MKQCNYLTKSPFNPTTKAWSPQNRGKYSKYNWGLTKVGRGIDILSLALAVAAPFHRVISTRKLWQALHIASEAPGDLVWRICLHVSEVLNTEYQKNGAFCFKGQRKKPINLKHFSDIKTIQLNVWTMCTVGGARRGELMELKAVKKQVHREKMDLNAWMMQLFGICIKRTCCLTQYLEAICPGLNRHGWGQGRRAWSEDSFQWSVRPPVGITMRHICPI